MFQAVLGLSGACFYAGRFGSGVGAVGIFAVFLAVLAAIVRES